jgi:hypothetical protein
MDKKTRTKETGSRCPAAPWKVQFVLRYLPAQRNSESDAAPRRTNRIDDPAIGE